MNKSLIYASQAERESPIYINILNKENQGYQKFEISPVQAMKLISALTSMIEPYVANPLKQEIKD